MGTMRLCVGPGVEYSLEAVLLVFITKLDMVGLVGVSRRLTDDVLFC